jgi:hypothetical protein
MVRVIKKKKFENKKMKDVSRIVLCSLLLDLVITVQNLFHNIFKKLKKFSRIVFTILDLVIIVKNYFSSSSLLVSSY